MPENNPNLLILLIIIVLIVAAIALYLISGSNISLTFTHYSTTVTTVPITTIPYTTIFTTIAPATILPTTTAGPASPSLLPYVNSTVVTAVSGLVVSEGGSSSTVPGFVDGSRSDGLNLYSSVGSVEIASDSPESLVSVFQTYNISSSDSVQQALLNIYNRHAYLQLTQTMISNLTSLVVANGGSQSTVASIVAGNRSDGINLHSTVSSLEYASDTPPTLTSLLQGYNISTGESVQQGFIDLYTLSEYPKFNISTIDTLSGLVVANGGYSSTVPSIVVANRTDGITLYSTLGELENTQDPPPALISLMQKYGISNTASMQEALVEIYNDYKAG